MIQGKENITGKFSILQVENNLHHQNTFVHTHTNAQ